MLQELHVRDLALIRSAELRFGAGLNVITGETGAGKSLLVGALELVLGETPKGGAAGWIRSGAKEARVDARFVLSDAETLGRVRAALAAEVPAIVEDLADSFGEGEVELVLGRRINAEGRTRAYVDQRPVTRRALREVARALVEIHGQNDHQRLLDPEEQRRLLDGFAGLGGKLEAYVEAREGWLSLVQRAERLEAERAERRDRLDLLRFQHRELEEAGLSAGEAEGLAEERNLLRNAGELRGELEGLVGLLSEEEGAVLDRLRTTEHTLARWSQGLKPLGAPLEDLRAAAIHVEEGAASLASFLDGVEVDPARLEAVEERLAEIERLEHKYALPAAELAQRVAELAEEVAALEGDEESLETLSANIAAAEEELARRAQALTKGRRAAGKRLATAVGETLGALGLANARFAVSIEPRGGSGGASPGARFGPQGADEVELLLAANPGEDVRPLRHVASGGEAARIMLALRTVLRAGDPGHTLVFDEVDAGVGGRLGPEVAAHLRTLGRSAQVLCVTHLPSIAAAAAVHLRAAKSVEGGRTATRVEELEGDARVGEVAAMIAGGADEATARAEASRLLSS